MRTLAIIADVLIVAFLVGTLFSGEPLWNTEETAVGVGSAPLVARRIKKLFAKSSLARRGPQCIDQSPSHTWR